MTSCSLFTLIKIYICFSEKLSTNWGISIEGEVKHLCAATYILVNVEQNESNLLTVLLIKLSFFNNCSLSCNTKNGIVGLFPHSLIWKLG